MKFRTILTSVIVLVLSFYVAAPAFAHSTEPRVEISKERLQPGEVVDLRGVSFDMDEPVTLTLLGQGVEIPLGEAMSNGEGEFTQIVVLPVELAEGTYYFRATTNHHYVMSPPLTVWGVAVVEGGGQGPRDEDDGLLAPMPTVAPAVPSMATASVQPVAVQTQPVLDWNLNLVMLAISIVVLVVIVVGFRMKSAR